MPLIGGWIKDALAGKRSHGVKLGRRLADYGCDEIILGLRAEGYSVAEVVRRSGFHRDAVNRVREENSMMLKTGIAVPAVAAVREARAEVKVRPRYAQPKQRHLYSVAESA